MAFMSVEELPVWQIEARQQPLPTSIKAAMLMSAAALAAHAAVGVSARVHSASCVLTAPARQRPSWRPCQLVSLASRRAPPGRPKARQVGEASCSRRLIGRLLLPPPPSSHFKTNAGGGFHERPEEKDQDKGASGCSSGDKRA